MLVEGVSRHASRGGMGERSRQASHPHSRLCMGFAWTARMSSIAPWKLHGVVTGAACRNWALGSLVVQ